LSSHLPGETDGCSGIRSRNGDVKAMPGADQNPIVSDANHDELIFWLAYREAASLLEIRKLKQGKILFFDNFNEVFLILLRVIFRID
jgi:hypothetical protein